MTVEQLLEPRYKLIADFPNSPFKVGEILDLKDEWNIDNYLAYDKYPHLFKRLEWWEERKLEDMPEYVRLNPVNTIGGEKVFIIKSWHQEHKSIRAIIESHEHMNAMFERYFLPATQSEYLNYINSTK